MDDDRGHPPDRNSQLEDLDALSTAYEHGYVSTPRETPLNEISRQLGISSREALIRLNNELECLIREMTEPCESHAPTHVPQEETLSGKTSEYDRSESVHFEPELLAFREAVEHTGHSIYITDSDGTLRYVNRTFEEITGYAAEEGVGRNPRILQSGLRSRRYYEKLWGTILAGRVWRQEVVNERKDGTRCHVDQTIAPVTDESGTIRYFVAINQIPS